MNNPFSIAAPVQKKLKILMYGPSGSGKTLAALSFPRVAVIDTESGTDLYAGRNGIAQFSVLRAKTIDEVMNALTFIRQDAGKSFDTVVIDPITVIYNVQKDGAFRASKTGDLTYRDWNRIGVRMKSLHDALTTLPTHVVITAREATEYENGNGELKKAGVKPDAHKDLIYIVDFVVRMTADHNGIVEKSRGSMLPRMAKVDWSIFAPIAAGIAQGKQVTSQTETEAVAGESKVYAWTEETAKNFADRWAKQGILQSDLFAALGNITRLGEWAKDEDAANEAVKQYIDSKVQA